MPRIYHEECSAACRYIGHPDHPPDPDRYGNMRYTHKCNFCGERTTVLVPPHGGMVVEDGFSEEDDIEWLVPL